MSVKTSTTNTMAKSRDDGGARILNRTTEVDSAKTIAEVQKILVAHGAHKITTDYNGTLPVALTFCLTLKGATMAFSLPCNYAGVLTELKRDRTVPRRLCSDEHALRVSWRILKDWVEAQMAIVQAGLAEAPEVFLPYAVTKSGRTLYQEVKENGSQQLLIG